MAIPQYGGYYPPQQYPQQEKSMLPIGAGIVLILGAIFGLIIGLLVFMSVGMFLGVRPTDPTSAENYDKAVGTVGVCGAFYFMTFVFALLGAVYCFKRTKWKIALLGAILGTVFPFVGPFTFIAIAPAVAGISFIFGIWGWLVGGGIFNLIGLILVIIAKKHFDIEQPQIPPMQPPIQEQYQPQQQYSPQSQYQQQQYQPPSSYQQPPSYQQPQPYQQPTPQYQPVKVRCGKCGNIIDVTTPQRPIELTCNNCGTRLRLS